MKKTSILYIFFFIAICIFYTGNELSAQAFNIKQFEKNLYLSQYLLQKQPKRDSLSKILPKEFKLDSITAFNYYIKDKFNQKIVVYLHIESLKIVYVELFENQHNYNDIKDYLINKKNYIWSASEHNCDYLNNKILSMTLCPRMKEGVMIHVSLYGI